VGLRVKLFLDFVERTFIKGSKLLDAPEVKVLVAVVAGNISLLFLNTKGKKFVQKFDLWLIHHLVIIDNVSGRTASIINFRLPKVICYVKYSKWDTTLKAKVEMFTYRSRCD